MGEAGSDAVAKGSVPAQSAAPALGTWTRTRRRDSILDAAGELMRRQGWDKTRMADVADRAGISRQTLYVEFGSREALAQETVLREVDLFLTAVEFSLATRTDDAQAAVAAAFEVFLLAIGENALVRALVVEGNSDELLPLLTVHGAPILDAARSRLADYMQVLWPVTAPDDADLLAECLIRLSISVATLPTRQPTITAEALSRMLGPFARDITRTGPSQAGPS